MGLIERKWMMKAKRKADTYRNETRLRYITKLFMILATEVWLRLFVTKEMKASERL